MCTLIVASGLWPNWPLIVAANRDEDLDRPAEPPGLRTHDGVQMLAPRDVKAGGTWIGLNEYGLFVGITNRFGPRPDPTLRSRGQLVLSTLTAPSAGEAFERAQTLDPRQVNGFHLVMADIRGAYVVYNDTATLTARALEPGWHIVTERSFDAAETAREPLIRRTIEGWSKRPPADSDLQALLSIQQSNGFDGVLVDVPAHNYGTRSSTIVRLDEGGRPTFLHADGRPDRSPFQDYSRQAQFETEGSA